MIAQAHLHVHTALSSGSELMAGNKNTENEVGFCIRKGSILKSWSWQVTRIITESEVGFSIDKGSVLIS